MTTSNSQATKVIPVSQVEVSKVTVVKELSLSEFFNTEIGHELWDSIEVRLVLNYKTTVLIVHMNAFTELDTLGLLYEDKFTTNIDKYVVEGFGKNEVDDINYIFIKEAH